MNQSQHTGSGAALADVKVWKLQILVWNLTSYSPAGRRTFFRMGRLISRFSSAASGRCTTLCSSCWHCARLGRAHKPASWGEQSDRSAGVTSSYMVQEKQHLLNYHLVLVKKLVVNLCKSLWSWKNPTKPPQIFIKTFFLTQSHFPYLYHKVFSFLFKTGEEQTSDPAEGQQSHQLGVAVGGGKSPGAEITLTKSTCLWQRLATHWWTSKDRVQREKVGSCKSKRRI